MKLITNSKKESRIARFPSKLAFKSIIAGTLLMAAIQSPLQAQVAPKVTYTQASWWFGTAAGVNFNFYEGTTQQLTDDIMAPTAFHDGQGIGLFAYPIIEYRRPGSKVGLMFHSGYESRRAAWEQVKSPCNCPEDLETDHLAYITVEPSIRFNPFKSNFYVYAGPRLAFNVDKRFWYDKGINPAYPDQVDPPRSMGVFSNMNKSLISMQIGAGYDISLTADTRKNQVVLSPFVSYHPYFGQDPRSVESWNLTTIRAGLALKFGRGRKVEVPEVVIVPEVVVPEPEVTFSTNSPKNVPADRTVIEVFPLRNYVYYDLGSNEIPNRYVKLRKDQVKDFNENQLEFTTPEDLSGSSKRQMVVYYNVLNILGYRMVNDPTAKITLVGSSEKGTKDGKEMAESTKKYLVEVFEIDQARIATEGRKKPKIMEEQPGGKLDLELLRAGDRRVSIESKSPGLLMEYKSGPDATQQAVPVPEAPIESYTTFTTEGADTAFTSWSLILTDEKGIEQNFGPYTKESVSLPGKSILGTRPEGDYKVSMIGQTKSGKVIRKETTAHVVRWTPPSNVEIMKFSIIYEFNSSKVIPIYNKYLTDVVTTKIPVNGKVIIQGYTDIIGGEEKNLKLSVARANNAKTILEKALAKAGRTDVKFEVRGLGEDQKSAPYGNKFPEERSYNRSAIIEVIPAK